MKKKDKDNSIVNDRVTESLKNQSQTLRANYEKYFETIKDQLANHSLKEIGWWLYYQGHVDTTETGVDLTKEEWETECFLNYIKGCIQSPSKGLDPFNAGDYVRITYPCPGHLECGAWPDNCENVGGDGETCSMLLNISKLCKTEDSEKIVRRKEGGKYLTREEVEQLSKILSSKEN